MEPEVEKPVQASATFLYCYGREQTCIAIDALYIVRESHTAWAVTCRTIAES